MKDTWLPQEALGEQPNHIVTNTDSGEDLMKDLHRSYFERRLTEERLAAVSCSDAIAKLTHLSFAQLYEARLAASFQTQPTSMADFAIPTPLEETLR
jgi:hypothetical protein